jgi:hypothetical protein
MGGFSLRDGESGFRIFDDNKNKASGRWKFV